MKPLLGLLTASLIIGSALPSLSATKVKANNPYTVSSDLIAGGRYKNFRHRSNIIHRLPRQQHGIYRQHKTVNIRKVYYQYSAFHAPTQKIYWNNRYSYSYHPWYNVNNHNQYVCNTSWFQFQNSLYCNYNNASYYIPYTQNYGYYNDNSGRQVLGIVGEVVDFIFFNH
jgi:hypothetical protein